MSNGRVRTESSNTSINSISVNNTSRRLSKQVDAPIIKVPLITDLLLIIDHGNLLGPASGANFDFLILSADKLSEALEDRCIAQHGMMI